MRSLGQLLLGTALSWGFGLQVFIDSPIINAADFAAADTITVDVCIVGGGSTGACSAVRLSEDFGKSTIVIEKDGRLGGHTNTYIDPITGSPVDYGVLGFHGTSIAKDYFSRFNISLTKIPLAMGFPTKYVDLATGEVLPGYSEPNPAIALLLLAIQLLKYPGLQSGYNLPNPVPEDLLLPFGDFVTKHGIQDAIPLMMNFQAIGDVLNTPTLYILQNFGLQQLATLATGGYSRAANHANSELYQNAATLLGSSVLYNSTIIQAERQDNGIQQIIVQTPTGKKLIKAKKLLITIPPTLNNLKPLDLDESEQNVFKQWQYTTYYCGIVRNGIPANISITNTAANSTLNIPIAPFIANLWYSGIPDLHTFQSVSNSSQTPEQVEAFVKSTIQTMQAVGTLPASVPTIEALKDHTPTIMRVSTDAIKNGFYSDLNALQAQHGTFWTGAAWAPDDSALLWAFTEGILARLVEALG